MGSALTQTNSTLDCIDINARNVNLYTAGFAINGPGSGNGVGINVLKEAKNANLQLGDPNNLSKFTTVRSFGTGIQIAGDNALLNNFESDNNIGDGVLIDGAKDCAIVDFGAFGNGANGINISGGSGCDAGDFSLDSNKSDGLVLNKANSDTFHSFDATSNGADGIAINSGSGNRLIDFASDSNSGNGIVISKSNSNYLLTFDAENNRGGAGIEFDSASSNHLVDYKADDNATFGTWLNGSSSNTVLYFLTSGNGTAGVYLGCSPTGPMGASCQDYSMKNIITSGQAGTDDTEAQAYGVAVDAGDLKNLLSGIGGSTNTTDLYDGNANCGTNAWVLNNVGTAYPSVSTACISTTP